MSVTRLSADGHDTEMPWSPILGALPGARHCRVGRSDHGRCGTQRSEDAVVRRLTSIFTAASGAPAQGEVWTGDDAAVVGRPPGPLVLCCDAVVEGVHCDLSIVGLDDLGWKAVATTVSDLGAVGARPSHVLLSFCAPPGTDLEAVARGAAEAATRWHCPVVGGDVTTSSQLMVSAAAAGVLEGPAPAVLRSGAAAGDTLFLTGPVGGAAAGLRVLRAGDDRARRGPGAATIAALVQAHRRPEARIAEGVTARAAGATAMMDVSDGLAIDLHRLAEASGVGIALDDVPVSEGATEEEALAGGEDYELLIATPAPRRLVAAFSAASLRVPVAVGRCTADELERTLRGKPFARRGFEHRLG